MTPLSGNVPLAACRRCHTPQLCVAHCTALLADSNVPLHHIPQLGVAHCTTRLADSNVPLHHVPQLSVSHFTARLADSNVPLHHVPQLCVTHCTTHLADSFLISHVISSERRQPVIEKSIPYTLPRPVAHIEPQGGVIMPSLTIFLQLINMRQTFSSHKINMLAV